MAGAVSRFPALLPFHFLAHGLCHRKASVSARMRSPRVSGAETRERSRSLTSRAGASRAGRGCAPGSFLWACLWPRCQEMGTALVLLFRVPKDCHGRGHGTAFPLAPSPLSGGRPLLCADGLLLGGLDPTATLTVLSGHLCWAPVPHPLSVQFLWVLRAHQEHDWAWSFPAVPEPCCASAVPASPQQSPHVLMFLALCESTDMGMVP